MHVRCPHCHNPIEIVDDVELADIPCPSCGSSFSLLDDKTKSYDPKTKTIGHFELVDQIGVGAFGSVWMARDTKLDRNVAVKIPRKEQLDSEDIEKFFREARAAAQLKHPNIVSVHEVGRDGDTIYIVSDFIQGLSLSDWLSGQQLIPKEAAELCAKIANALHHAHEAGIIHRDLKPSNIMLDGDGEPHIMDFGLAKREAGEITMTMDGKILGTPAYMSPEQAKGEAHSADRRSDVYSLGVVLFELLTGEYPFRGNSRMLIHQVIHQDAPSPRTLNTTVPRDLETICLKCLQKEQPKRYQTAKTLADDLVRAVREEPIHARATSRLERAVRWCKREPAKATALFAVALIPVILSGALIRQTILTRQNAIARVDVLLNASPMAISVILDDLDRQASVVLTRLRELDSQELSPQQQIRVSLALLPFDPNQLDKLQLRLNDCTYDELSVVLDRLRQNGGTELAPELWTTYRNEQTSENKKFRAGIALAALDPQSESWEAGDYQFLINSLLAENSLHQPAIRHSLSQIAVRLLNAVKSAYESAEPDTLVDESSANAMVDLGSDNTELLAELSMVSTPKQHSIVFPIVARSAESDETIVDMMIGVTKLQPAQDDNEATRVALGKRRAGAAINLVRMGRLDESLEVLRITDDPESLTQFVHGCKGRGVTVTQLLDLLTSATSVTEHSGILLALGEFSISDMPEEIRPTWVDYVKNLYAKDPRSGIHGVSGWLLREWGLTEEARAIEERSVPYSEDREWFTLKINLAGSLEIENNSYFTFVVFPAGEYRIGSPEYELDRSPGDEILRSISVTRSFAVLDREVTRGEVEDVTGFSGYSNDREWEADRLNANAGNEWYLSVSFCRKLSLLRGQPEYDQAYSSPSSLDRNEYPADAETWMVPGAPKNWPFDISKSGFRLPTSAEWEIACRGSMSTTFGFGCDREILGKYGQYLENSSNRGHRPRKLRPNTRGIFDMHGNMFEWCHNWYGRDNVNELTDPTGSPDGTARVLQGGGWLSVATYCRSSQLRGDQPTDLTRVNGFRIVFTIPSVSGHPQ